MAHTLTEADQTERPGRTGEQAHDDVCHWLGFHSGPTLTDGIPALDVRGAGPAGAPHPA